MNFLAARKPRLDASGVLPKTDWLGIAIALAAILAGVTATVFHFCGVFP